VKLLKEIKSLQTGYIRSEAFKEQVKNAIDNAEAIIDEIMGGDANFGMSDDVEKWFDSGNNFSNEELSIAHEEILKALAKRY